MMNLGDSVKVVVKDHPMTGEIGIIKDFRSGTRTAFVCVVFEVSKSHLWLFADSEVLKA